MWAFIRSAASWLAGLVFAVAVVAPVSNFAIAWWDERGAYKHPSDTVHAALAYLAAFTGSPWFHWVGGGVVGFALGAWLDTIFGKRANAQGLPTGPRPDIEISFDTHNPGDRFFFWEEIEKVTGFTDGKHVTQKEYKLHYYLKFQNNTTKTLREFEVRALSWPHRAYNLTLLQCGAIHCDLHPNASEYVEICSVDSKTTSLPSSPGGEPYQLEIIASAIDVPAAHKRLLINTQDLPGVTLLD